MSMAQRVYEDGNKVPWISIRIVADAHTEYRMIEVHVQACYPVCQALSRRIILSGRLRKRNLHKPQDMQDWVEDM